MLKKSYLTMMLPALTCVTLSALQEIPDLGFEEEGRYWQLRSGVSLKHGEGRNSSTALCIERKDDTHRYSAFRDFPVQSGKRYLIGCRVKGTVLDVGKYKLGAGFNLAFYQNGKVIGRVYQKGMLASSDEWIFISKVVDMPPVTDTCRVMPDFSGKGRVLYDDFVIIQANKSDLAANMDFELDHALFEQMQNGSIDRSGGINASAALFFERNDPAKKAQIFRDFHLTPGKRYLAGAWIKGEIRSAGQFNLGGSLRVVFLKGTKVLGNVYIKGLNRTGSWQFFSGEFTVPAEADLCRLYLGFSGTGKVWFDNLELRECGNARQSNMDFTLGGTYWNLLSGFQVTPDGGKGNSPALFIERTDENKVTKAFRDFPVIPGRNYLIGAWIRGTVNTPGRYNLGGTVELTMLQKGKVIQRIHIKGVNKSSDNWKFTGRKVTIPQNADTCRINFIFGGTGKIWYDDITVEELNEQTVLFDNLDFENGMEKWVVKNGYTIDPEGGRYSSAALTVTRKTRKENFLIYRDFPLQSGKTYRIGFQVRGEVTDPGQFNLGAGYCMVFYRDKQVISRFFRKGLRGKSDRWQFVGEEVTVPDGTTHARLIVDFSGTGKIWIDDVTIQPVTNYAVYPAAPGAGNIPGEDPVLRVFASVSGGSPDKLDAVLELEDGTVFKTKFAGNFAAFDLSQLAPGSYSGELFLLDGEKKLASGTAEINLRPRGVPVPENSCVIDRKGRALVNDKPFLPIGLYMGGISAEDIAEISQSDFNTLLPYSSLALRGKDEKKTYEAAGAIRQIRGVLDQAAQKNIRIIFSLTTVYDFASQYKTVNWYTVKGSDNVVNYLVQSLRDHPALLAWYICDEIPVEYMPQVSGRRKLINSLDPWHPTLAISCKPTAFAKYAPATDILGHDSYPILNKNTRDISALVCGAKMIERQGKPLWNVVQLFRWGSPDREKLLRHRDPTLEEMRAMSISYAINGAKGFIFYHYADLIRPEKHFPGYYKRRWPEAKQVASMLKNIAPYLLSDHDPQELKFTGDTGRIQAKIFRDDRGKRIVLICSEGPGKNTARFQLDGKFKSAYNHTVENNGFWNFTGEDISADILFEE
ncbi:MAG: hypothetical protein E7058_05495 [Lentisphaerae bacterium]|nr:hypothetical protein [Lentisphaerota bacterium]